MNKANVDGRLRSRCTTHDEYSMNFSVESKI